MCVFILALVCLFLEDDHNTYYFNTIRNIKQKQKGKGKNKVTYAKFKARFSQEILYMACQSCSCYE
jgi:hypothetical protein